MTGGTVTRKAEWLEHDKKMVRGLVQLGVGVELFTIPLYMTALYSIPGRKVYDDGSVFPYMGPTENYPLKGEAAQKAYNLIYSVYIQEMLHMQLAMNILNIIGGKPDLSSPVPYPPNPAQPHWIPCLGNLPGLLDWDTNSPAWKSLSPETQQAITELRAKTNSFRDTKAELGPLDSNQIDLFLAIELPDDYSASAVKYSVNNRKPGEGFHPENKDPFQPDQYVGMDFEYEGVKIPVDFGGIKNLYDIISAMLGFTYENSGGKTLFAYCYEEAALNALLPQSSGQPGGNQGKIVQINYFGGQINYDTYHMTLELTPGASVEQALAEVVNMVDGIISQGEGSSLDGHNFVSPDYVPGDGGNSPDVDALWDAYSHFARFEYVQSMVEEIETWPKWYEKNKEQGPWTWEDLVADPIAFQPGNLPASMQTLKSQALDKATAYNGGFDPGTSDPRLNKPLKELLNDVLNGTYGRFLNTLQQLWTGTLKSSFPYGAMQAISSRVSAVYAAGGLPEFKVSNPPEPQEYHACQGLNLNIDSNGTVFESASIGLSDCSTAVMHTCANTNSCSRQGGCGYNAFPQDQPENYKYNFIPGENGILPNKTSAVGTGGCGAPIPASQILHVSFGTPEQLKLNGKNVWQQANDLFKQRLQAEKEKGTYTEDQYNQAVKNLTNKSRLETYPLRMAIPPS
ncbi:MAG: hypothetical protein KDA88_22955 [Planctomycetaceae bacterium]|nr:hypothetical protein [Planctomycetaceae bacterium]MCB9949861.1 hypothetical protein [Planctomycetaceae bacterium]